MTFRFDNGDLGFAILSCINDVEEYVSVHTRNHAVQEQGMKCSGVAEGKLMVLYDHEERISVAIGNLWYEKGIDNFVILTGTSRSPLFSFHSRGMNRRNNCSPGVRPIRY
eukprot:768448-Hanusia_phi.AAC.7